MDVERDLEIVAPVAPVMAIWREDRVVEENFQTVEVGAESVEDDDVWSDDKEVAGECGVRLVELVEKAPRDQERNDFGFSRTRGELQHIARPLLRKHAGGYRAGCIEADEIVFVARLPDLVEPDDRFDRLALGEIVLERRERAVAVLNEVLRIEPMAQECGRGGGSAGIACISPRENLFANFRDHWRQQLFIGRAAHFLSGWKPAVIRVERQKSRYGKFWMQGHKEAGYQIFKRKSEQTFCRSIGKFFLRWKELIARSRQLLMDSDAAAIRLLEDRREGEAIFGGRFLSRVRRLRGVGRRRR